MKRSEGKWLLIDDVRHYPCDDIARDGREGLRKLRDGNYEGLLIDYQLSTDPSDINGYDILRRLDISNRMPRYVNVVSTHPDGHRLLVDFLAEIGYCFVADKLDCQHFILNEFWSKDKQEPIPSSEKNNKEKRKVTVRL